MKKLRRILCTYVSLKNLGQCQNFRDRLVSVNDKAIYYKQPNYSREDEAYWGVSNPTKLISVLPPNSLAGNNIMGELIMDLLSKIFY